MQDHDRAVSAPLVPPAAAPSDAARRATGGDRRLAYRYLLVLRFALFNVVGFGLLAAVFLQGWLDGARIGSTGWLCAIIFAVFLFGLGLCARRVWRVSREMNDVRTGRPRPGSHAARYLDAIAGLPADSRSISAGLLRLRLSVESGVVRHFANSLVFLGLVGTVVGFIIALAAIDPQKSVSVDTVAATVATLIHGMSIALYTTLVGSVLHLWLSIDHRLLATGSMRLYAEIVSLGERRVGA